MSGLHAVFADRVMALLAVAIAMAACVGGGAAGSATPPVGSVAGPSSGLSAPSGTNPTGTPDCDAEAIAAGRTALPHQAPDAENVLPASVSGRPLARWSVSGRCVLDLVISKDAPGRDAAFAGIDLSVLALGVAGRSDTHADPPYFVFSSSRPHGPKEVEAAVVLLFAAAGFPDVAAGPNLDLYSAQTISGKEVFVGTTDMVRQNEHTRGRPYLYQTDAWMFIVITDSDGWAADAVRQLP
jgi:hypothetical protein